MAQMRRLIVGLGNPTPQYDATRHNVGFAVLDRLAGNTKYRVDGRANALVAHKRLRGRRAVLAKPQTFMNHSGFAVRKLMQRHALTPEAILVVVDDLNLPLGMIRVRADGSAGGHNGMQDVIDHLNSQAFARIRIGIGGSFERGQQSRFVLTPFLPDEMPVVDEAVRRAAQAAVAYVTDGITTAMNRHNRRIRSESPPTKQAEPQGLSSQQPYA